MTAFDTIIIGLGGVGSAAAYHLAARGVRVLGLDQFPIAHDRGSSHGSTRVIRQAYFEHADYVPLVIEFDQLGLGEVVDGKFLSVPSFACSIS